MFFHGGGWVLGDFHTHERLLRDLVNESGAAAVFVNDEPSPEAHYPVAINQAYEATKWVSCAMRVKCVAFILSLLQPGVCNSQPGML